MKTTMKQLAAGTFIALLLLAANVKAEGTERKVSNIENIETTLQLKNWMTDETIWNNNSFSNNEFVQEAELSMEIESWMTSEHIWNLNNNFFDECETGMELESWMTSEEIWNIKNINSELELTIENWMIDRDIWK